MDKRENLILQISTQLVHYTNRKARGPKSNLKKVLVTSLNVRDMAEAILDVATRSLSNGLDLTTSSERLGVGLNNLSSYNLKTGTPRNARKSLINAGCAGLGILGELGYIKVVTERQGVMKKNRIDFATEDSLFFDYFVSIGRVSEMDLPKEEYTYWTHPHKAGFPIVKKMPSELTNKYLFKKMPKVYNALNAYGSTEFKVNEELLDVIMQMDEDKSEGVEQLFIPEQVSTEAVSESLANLMKYNRTSEYVGEQAKKWYLENVSAILQKKGLSTVQIDGRSNTYKKRKASGWLKQKSTDELDVIRLSSKRYEFNKVTSMASQMRGKKFHYDFQLDSRGRFYPTVNYFEPTGSDLAKGLLMFNRGVSFSENVIYSLAIHTANCMGEDKLSMDDRYLYVLGHMGEILEASEDLVNSEWLKGFKGEKKTKFQLMAAILEWKKYDEQGEDYVCHLPIGLDATNSGLQILSAMTRDVVGAQETNVINHPEKEIGDAYMVIANSVLDGGFSYKGYEDLDKKMWRKLCKRPTMSYYYDAGRGCIQEQTFEDRREHGNDYVSEMTFDDATYLGTAIYDGVEVAFPRQTQAKEALKAGVKNKLIENEGKSLVTWKTASGFTAFQNYAKTEMHTVKCNFAGKEHQLSYQVFTDKARKSDHDKGISANFVHSQDASLLALTIANLAEEGIEDFMMIHDQFSVNAEEVNFLLSTFKSTFKDIFEDDQLGNTLKSFGLESNPVDYGDLDLDDILDAKYIIS